MLKTRAEDIIGNAGFPFERSYTVGEFCEAERISRVMLYEHWKEGRGPDFYLNGKRRIITHNARLEWQRRMMAQANGGHHGSAS